MSIAVALALLFSFGVYLTVGWRLSQKTKGLADLLPVVRGKQARVENSAEFSASTVATTISLATIIVAYFELVPSMGLWLLWTVITTVVGIGLLAFSAKAIWRKMSTYDHRPSLHEFLGTEFRSPAVAMIGAACTSLGFLLIFAVELTVGARFLASMIPEIPQWLTVIVLAFVGFLYTTIGGFRAVVRTDFIQMRFIWMLLLALAVFLVYRIIITPASLSEIPVPLYDFSWREGLGAFLFGIAVMNIPTHISNMSIWQRIAASGEPKTVVDGLWRSVLSSALSWGGFVVLAVLTFTVSKPAVGENLLITFLKDVSATVPGKILIFFATLGLYGAMLSTASTQLIVVSHTVYEDILSKFRKASLTVRIGQKSELAYTRKILLVSAVLSVGTVEVLNMTGFSVADLVFAIYGGQLVLFPIVMMALFLKSETLKKLSKAANWAIVLGFIAGWGSAFVGKVVGDNNLVFLAPGISIAVSSIVLLAGRLSKNNKRVSERANK